MEVKIKKLVEEAVVPKYAHSTDAGLDLTATSFEIRNGVYIYFWEPDHLKEDITYKFWRNDTNSN